MDGLDGFAGWHFVVGAIIEDIEINEPRHRDAVHALQILRGLVQFTYDPRYRPSLWLVRRASLEVSLLTPEG